MTRPSDPLDGWLARLVERHTSALSTREYLKAVRALSARYVERRAELSRRSPLDSPGKRAAFAGFFAPLHFLTTREILAALRPTDVDTIVDLGCGSGAASAAWALGCPTRPALFGVDKLAWPLDEARWNWRQLGLNGRTRRGDLVRESRRLADSRRQRSGRTGVILAWAVNELDDRDRQSLLPALLDLTAAGSAVIVIEPIARSAAPWWDTWAGACQRAGGRVDQWQFRLNLPAALSALSEAAGFDRQTLGARSLWLGGRG